MNAKPQLNTLAPSMKEAERMLDMLDAGGEFTFQTFADADKNKNLVHIYHGSLEAHFDTLARLNGQGAGVFVTVNQTDLQGRTSDNVTRVRALWVDFDTVDHARLDRLMNMDGIPPNLIIESSAGKHHAYWIIAENDEIPLNQFTELQKRLIHHFADDGADKAIHDLPRVMRLTGFYHRKGEAFMTQVVHSDEWRDAADLIAWIESLPMPEVAKPKAQAEKPQARQTQQTHYNLDFKQAKLLARGRWPEIFNQLGYPFTATAPNEHVTCPMCGGVDRFRFDNENGDGSFICSQGTGEPIAGDGFTLLEHGGKSTAEALQAVTHALSAMGLISEYDNSKTDREWGEPQLLHIANQYVEGEYPIHAFPDVIAKAIKKSAHFHNVPLAVAAQTYLGEQAYIAQRHIKAPSDKSEKGQPCSLFMLTIFPSGEGKDVCKNDASKISGEIESENMNRFYADYKSWSKKKLDERGDAPVNPMSRFKKTTTQGIIRKMADGACNSYIWATGEGGYLFSGYSLKSDTVGESISVLNDLVDTGKGNALLRNAEDSHFFENKYFSLDIAVQDVVARPALTNSLLREQGFLARVLFAAPTPLQHREVTLEQQSIKPYDDEDLKAYWQFCEKMLTTPYFGNKLFVGDDGRVIITKCQDAERLHIQYQNHIGQEVGKGGKYEFIRAYALRTNQYVLRVAAILAYCSEVDYIDARIMQNAIDLCKYSLDEWLRYYGKAEKSDSELMLEWLKKQDSSKILKSAISTTVYPKHLRSKNSRDAALSHLIDAEYIHIEQIGKKEYVVLNPLFSIVG
ncbi:DUF3987 domain-containing protein [Acinetobacter towneri]|uniref:DUF3987 domain-containing protein n=1 Tax=Acinetobacter towneri TaxID=202956 RepID=UPI002DBC1E51|nr:DUF3987 domain-containing protein [Acinetobacter towneri]MEB6564010.1 DUF3987 domain-containing protein [Acinetobacter towneri]